MIVNLGNGKFFDKTLDPTIRNTGIQNGEEKLSQADISIKIKNLLKENPNGMTTEDIAKSLPSNRITISKYLNTLLISGQIEYQRVGRSKLFRYCSRVPISQMFALHSDAIVVMDKERLIREINPQFLEMFGIPKRDLIGEKFDTLISEVDIAHILIPGICQAAKGVSVTKKHELKKGGENLHFQSKYLPVVFDDGVPGTAVILENVTENHQIQQKYEKIINEMTNGRQSTNDQIPSDVSRDRVGNTAQVTSRIPSHQVIENLSDLVLEIDTNLKPGYVSPSHQTILGYSTEELMTDGVLDLIHPDEREMIISALHKFVNNKEPIRQKYRVRHKNGDYVWVESVGKPICDAAGTCTGGIISSRDISEQVCRMDALRIYYELFHVIFDYADDVVFLVSVNRDGTLGKFIDVNEVACRHLGYSHKELKGMPAGDILSRTAQSTILPIIVERIHEPSNEWFDAIYTRNAGKVIPVEVLVRIILQGEEKIAMVAVREK